MIDLLIIETGNGGDAVFRGKDFVTTESFINMPYFGMFGGNPGFPSEQIPNENEQQFDWWGNRLLTFSDPQVWITSRLEHLLNNISLTSANRSVIIRTIQRDIEFMEEFAQITVDVQYINVDRIRILIRLIEPDTLQENTFVFIWNATEAELTPDGIYESILEGQGIGLDNLLNFDL